MILWEEDLINYGLTKEQIATSRDNGKLHVLLQETRDAAYSNMVSGLLQGELDAVEPHERTMEFHEQLVSYTPSPQADARIQDYILKFNMSGIASISTYHIYFCLDDSGSMSNNWKDLVAGVRGFNQRRIAMCQNANSIASDLVTIVNYSNTAQVMCRNVDINANPETRTQFRSGGTDFAVGLNLVITEMRNIQNGYQPVLVFMSDGGSGTGDKEIRQVATEFKDKCVDIFLLGFGRGCNSQKLKNMAKISGGEYFFGGDAAQLKAEFEAISTKISSVSF